VIPFTGLSIGKHTYEFDIDKKFFDVYGTELIHSGQIKVVLDLSKSANMLLLEFSHKGVFYTECDRCLNDIEMPIEGKNKVVIKFGTESGDESDEIFVLPTEAHEIDVAPLIYEYIGISVPYRRVPADCDETDKYCDTEIGNRLSGIILTGDDEEDEIIEPEPDPRWQKLKNLLDDNNNDNKSKKE
jgi:uncharacterized metal-binding protein YceD (DUF177 family)